MRSCCPSSTRWAPRALPSPSVAALHPRARVAHCCLLPGLQSLDYDNSENQLFLEEERRINHTVSPRRVGECLCVCLCVSVSLCICVYVSVCLCVCHLRLCVCVYVSLCVSI